MRKRQLGKLLFGAGCVAVSAVLLVIACTREKPPTHDEIAGAPALKARAEDLKQTVITPHLEQRIEPGKNILWCSTFQLAWNELCTLAGEDIHLQNEPPMVSILNKKTSTKNDLDYASYVAMAGVIGDDIIERIKTELEKKFQGQASPELLQEAEGLPPDYWVAYSYLFKALPFRYAFAPFKKPLKFAGKDVSSFGIYGGMPENYQNVRDVLVEQVRILDFKNDDDFLIELRTKIKEEQLILAKIPAGGNLEEAINTVKNRMALENPDRRFTLDQFQAPSLNFDVLREYSELYESPIVSGNTSLDGMPIIKALQSIRFVLNRTGAVLKSEAIAACGEEAAPRYVNCIFDKPFLILLQRKDAKNLYFALWVDNAELLVPFAK